MSDLISRSALIEELKRQIEHCVVEDVAKGLRHAIITIEEQPIAYDKEAVVEAIHNLRLDDTAHCDETTRYGGCDNFGSCAECVLARVEDWVKAGEIDG